MPLMQWDETMSVGVRELDDQHKELIDLINEAYEAIQKHDQQMVSVLINKMRTYAVHHFEVEEAYLKQYDFPDITAHQRMHNLFNQEVDGFLKDQFRKTNFSKIFVFLSRWLTNHIMVADQQYAAYVPSDVEPDAKEDN